MEPQPRLILVPRKIDPLFQAEQLSLPVGEVLVQAMLRAKLLMRKSVAYKAEPAIARRAVDRCLSDIGISIFAQRSSAFRAQNRAFIARPGQSTSKEGHRHREQIPQRRAAAHSDPPAAQPRPRASSGKGLAATRRRRTFATTRCNSGATPSPSLASVALLLPSGQTQGQSLIARHDVPLEI